MRSDPCGRRCKCSTHPPKLAESARECSARLYAVVQTRSSQHIKDPPQNLKPTKMLTAEKSGIALGPEPLCKV